MIDLILELSTAHVTEEDMEKLKEETSFSVASYEYGLFMYISTDEYLTEYSDSLRKVIHYAREKKCRFVVLDQDGPILHGDDALDINDW
jgi:hypothetical protein